MSRNIKYTILSVLLSIISAAVSSAADNTTMPSGPDTADSLFFKAHNLLLKGENEKSKELLTKVISEFPEYDAAYFYLARMALFSNAPYEAEMMLNKAISIDPDNYWYNVQLAQIYISEGKMDKAIEVYEKLKDKNPKKYDIYYSLVDLYINNGNNDDALKILDQIETVSGKSEASVLTRFNILYRKGEQKSAFEYITGAGNEIATPRIYTLIGDIYAEKFADTLSISYYDKALSLEPDYAPAYFGRAEVYRSKSFFANYFSDINRFLASESVMSDIKVEYFNSILKNKKFVVTFLPQVDTMLISLIASDPENPAVNEFASSYYTATGRADKGVELQKKAIEKNPDNQEAAARLLGIYFYAEDWDTLIRESDPFLKKFPDNPVILQMNAIAEWQKKNGTRSLELFGKLAEILADNGDSTALSGVLTSMGDIHMEMGDSRNAWANYKKALKYSPDNIVTLNNFAYSYATAGKNLKKAYQMSKTTIEKEPDNPTYLDTYAWILHLMGNDIEAKAMLKHALLYGGQDSADILDHYAEILFSLGEYDMAFMYWMQADMKDKSMGLKDKMEQRKREQKEIQAKSKK